MADVLNQASTYTSDAAIVALVAGVVVLLAYFFGPLRPDKSLASDGEEHEEHREEDLERIK